MTDEQHKRVHDITYSCDDRAELAERIVALEDENEKLRDKNMLCAVAKRGIRACYDNLSEQYKELESENAKLREFAESYAKAVECEGCGWCPYDIDAVCGTETMPMRDGCRLYDELRELGVEVDE